MKNIRKVALILIIFSLTFAPLYGVKAQQPTENMKTFFDSEIPGIKIQVNATAETQPTENITMILSLKRQTDVYVKYFNFSVFGFLNGTDKVLMANISDNNFSLEGTPKEYNCTFKVPEQVWDVTYGEITLTYNVTYTVGSGILIIIPYENLKIGFTMTHVENIYLKSVEEQLKSLTNIYDQLNQTYWELQQNYTTLQGNLNELGNTRMAVGILAVTTVFFVATTLYLVMRKPKESW
jgi:hypothetical protein